MTEQQRFQRLFRGRETCYGQYTPLKDGNKKVSTVPAEAEDKHWAAHLKGTGPFLGQVPIRQDNHCFFGAIDVDEDGVDLAHLDELVSELCLPLVVCRSKSGGAHLYLFLEDPAPAKLVKNKLTSWAKALGRTENPDGRPIEIFPKQDRLKSNETGNWINLPYYNAVDTNRYAVVEGERLSLEEFLDRAEEMMVTSTELEMIEPATDDPEPTAFAEGPPCLEALDGLGFPAGARNQGLFQVGVFFKQAFKDDWKAKLEEYNQSGKLDPPLSASEVVDICKSLDKRDYNYQCDQLPIAPHCQKATCKKRKFGVLGMSAKKRSDAFPELTGLVKVMTDPPRWLLTVNGEAVDLETEDLMAMIRFRKKCLEQLSIMVPTLKQNEWDEILRELLATHTVQHAPEDAGVKGQFNALVREFLERRRQSFTIDDLLMGKPWEDEQSGQVFFRSVDLDAHLKRRNFRDYTPAKVYMVLRDMGAGHGQRNIKGAVTKVWWLPSPKGEQTEDFDAPDTHNPKF